MFPRHQVPQSLEGAHMGLIMSDFYETLRQGVDDATSQIPVTQEKTEALRPLIEDVDYISHAVACLCALLLRYPEPKLIKLAIQRLLDLRPQTMGLDYRRWKKEVHDLSVALRGHYWGEYFRQQLTHTYPKVAMNIWGFEAVRVAS